MQNITDSLTEVARTAWEALPAATVQEQDSNKLSLAIETLAALEESLYATLEMDRFVGIDDADRKLRHSIVESALKSLRSVKS